MARNDYYTNREMNSEDIERGFLFGFRKLLDTADSSDLWIVAPTQAQMSSSDFAAGLGEEISSALAKHKTANVSGRQVRFFTSLTLPGSAPKAVVIAVYPDKKLMTKLDGMTGPSDLIVVPFQMDDIQSWVEGRGPIDILSSTPAAKATVTDPVVVAALTSLLGSINRSTGVQHQLDKARAIDTFRALRDASIPVNASEVRAWLVQQKLAPTHADDIAAIAANPNGFQRPGTSTLREDIVEVWKENIVT